mgnify:FL=1
MKKWYYIGMFFMFLAAWACDQEDDLTPSGHEKEWMIIKDSDDPLDKLRYEIFRDYGVPTYYNDTIGSEERVDMSGNMYTYYECLKIFYYPGGATSTNYSDNHIIDYVEEDAREATLIPVLNEFRDQIFSRFKVNTRLPAFFFADSIGFTNIREEYFRIESYYGYNTFAVNLDSLPFLGVEKFTRKTLEKYFSGLLASSVNASWKEAFLQVTRGLKERFEYSTDMGWGAISLADALAGTSFTKKEELGFMVSFLDANYGNESIPTESMDISSYVDAVLTRTEADFAVEYGEYKSVMEKFRMMRSKLVELGYLFTN